MERPLTLYDASIGKKALVALSGFVLFGFVIVHMLGNLQVFAGPDALNAYARGLRKLPALLWAVRLVLLASVLAHIVAVADPGQAVRRRARRVGYRQKKSIATDYAARTMKWSGPLLAALRRLPPRALHLAGHRDGRTTGTIRTTSTPTSSTASGSPGWWRSTSSPRCCSGCTSTTAPGACSSRWGSAIRATTAFGSGCPRLVALGVVAGNVAMPLAVAHGSSAAMSALRANAPSGPLDSRWERHRFGIKLVNPANRRKYEVLVVGTGLAGAAAAATLAELGYRVRAFCFQDSPRRAHSIAAQGGINAAKNYQNDGDSVFRLFYDTIKGGDFRSRESNVYRLAEVSVNIIDQSTAQGVPFAREYGGMLANRSFGGAQVSRTFYARGQTGQQLLLGAYQALARQIERGQVLMHPRTEMLDLIVVDGRARGIVTRDLITGEVRAWLGDAVVLATGGYGNVFYLSTNAKGCNATAIWRAHKRGALFANPCFTQIHPTCIPVSGEYQSKLTLMSESLRNDGRVWVPLRPEDCHTAPGEIPESERDYYLERLYPSFGNLVPRDIASRRAKDMCDEGRGVGPEVGGTRRGVYLDFRDAIRRLGKRAIVERYGNLFEMYERITGEDPYAVPMRIYPASHYTMGGLWVDYNLMSTIDGLFVAGEANFSDHGANRLGASALMQGLGRRLLRPALHARQLPGADHARQVSTNDPAVSATARRGARAHRAAARRSAARPAPDIFHRELGHLMWDHCGMSRNERRARPGRSRRIPEPQGAFWRRPEDRRQRRRAQPDPRAGRARGGLPRARRADVPRRARARRVLRLSLPRGAHDRGGRGRARRRPLHPRRGLGVRGRGRAAGAPHRGARLRVRQAEHEELPVTARMLKLTLAGLAPEGAERAPGASSATPATTVSEHMSFLEMLDVVNERLLRRGRGAHRLRPRLPRRASAARAAWSSTAWRTARRRRPPPASFTCATSRTATRS